MTARRANEGRVQSPSPLSLADQNIYENPHTSVYLRGWDKVQ